MYTIYNRVRNVNYSLLWADGHKELFNVAAAEEVSPCICSELKALQFRGFLWMFEK